MSSFTHVLANEQTHTPICKKTKWMPNEDKLLQQGIYMFGLGQWTKICESIPGRSPKQCRERWTGQLDPSLNHSDWSAEEDFYLMQLHAKLGNAWARISAMMPGRAANAVKNRFRFISKCKQPKVEQSEPVIVQNDIELSPEPLIPANEFFFIDNFETEDWI